MMIGKAESVLPRMGVPVTSAPFMTSPATAACCGNAANTPTTTVIRAPAWACVVIGTPIEAVDQLEYEKGQSCGSSCFSGRGRFDETHPPAAGSLGAIHGAICTDQHCLRRISGHGERDPDAGAHLDADGTQIDRLLNFRNNGVRDLLGLQAIGDSDERNDELVTTGACDQVTAPGVTLEDSGNVTQHLVAALVSLGVVDLLEIVEIDLQKSQLGRCVHGEGGAQTHIQATSVEKPCQSVLRCQTGQLFGRELFHLALGDVVDDTLQRGGTDWIQGHLDPRGVWGC